MQQLQTVWSQTSTLARVGMVGTVVLCVAAIVGVGIWSARPQYVPIASDLGPSVAAEIVSKLDAEGISYRLNFSGSTVSVPQSQWNKAHLLLGNLISPEAAPIEFLGDSLLSDPSLNHFKILRHKEATLARTIGRMSGVENATVHVSQPEPSPFVRDAKPTTASVVLELRRGSSFSREEAATIVALVASSVEGLQADQVTVVDTSGQMLSSNSSGVGEDIASQYEYKRQVEADLAARAEYMLTNMLGVGKAVVRVAADVDFTRTSRESTTYDPDSKVKTWEKINSTTRTDPQPTPSVGAGTSSNLGGRTGGAAKTTLALEKVEENETEFETPKTVDVISEPMGTIKRLTVAAMVDLPTEQQANTTVGKEQVEAILKQAVGFDAQRGDEIEVVITTLAGIPAVDTPAATPLPDLSLYSGLIRSASLGVGALVALVLGFLILRRLRPVSVPADHAVDTREARARHIAALSEQAMANPEAVARVIEMWLKQSAGEPAVVSAANPATVAEPTKTKQAA